MMINTVLIIPSDDEALVGPLEVRFSIVNYLFQGKQLGDGFDFPKVSMSWISTYFCSMSLILQSEMVYNIILHRKNINKDNYK